MRSSKALIVAGTLLGVAAAWAPAPTRSQSAVIDGCRDEVGPGGRDDVRALRQALERGVLYETMVRRAGAPTGCRAYRPAETALEVAYAFGASASLAGRIDPVLELSQQSLRGAAMPRAEAEALLKAAVARDAAGCSMVWDQSAREAASASGGTADLVFRGTACNCQGRITLRDAAAIGVAFGSAC